MRKHLLLSLLILIGIPFHGVVSDLPAPPPENQICSAAIETPDAPPALDLSQPFDPQAMTPASSCGSNFCTQAQMTQCAQSCRHHPFVGLECCADTCTSFCNCGSVPTGC